MFHYTSLPFRVKGKPKSDSLLVAIPEDNERDLDIDEVGRTFDA